MIIVITGPTGVGKTKLSEELALKYEAVIVNADATQVYKELCIGTAKIKEEEKLVKEHFLFDIKNLTEEYNVREYQKDLRKILDNHKNKNIIIVGGTGLYISAGLFDYQFEEETNNDSFDNFSDKELYDLALKKDSNLDIHPNNRVRLIRFLNKSTKPSNGNKLLYNALFIGLTTSREVLYSKIDNRVDIMLKEGLIDEVKNLKKYENSSRVLNTAIGYKEILSYLNNKITLEEATSLIKKNSRHYAKRQYTWFNNKMNVNWFDVDYNNFSNTINEVTNYIEKQKELI